MVTQQYVQKIARGYVEQLGRKIRVQEAILTGSWAKGSYLEDSDVDLLIVSNDFSRMSLPERLVYLQKAWRNKLPLEAFGYTTKEFRALRRNSTYVRDAVRYGVWIPGAPVKKS